MSTEQERDWIRYNQRWIEHHQKRKDIVNKEPLPDEIKNKIHCRRVKWDKLAMNYKLSDEFIAEFTCELEMGSLIKYQKLSVEFLRKNWHSFSREGKSKISQYQNLSEDFMREFFDELDMEKISQYQNLSEGFLWEFSYRKNRNVLDVREGVAIYQNISKAYIRHFTNKLDWTCLAMAKDLDDDLIKEFISSTDNECYDDSRCLRFISFFQVLEEETFNMIKSKSYNYFHRQNIIFSRDIEPRAKLCEEIKGKYLAIWSHDQEITWNTFLEKFIKKEDLNLRYRIYLIMSGYI